MCLCLGQACLRSSATTHHVIRREHPRIGPPSAAARGVEVAKPGPAQSKAPREKRRPWPPPSPRPPHSAIRISPLLSSLPRALCWPQVWSSYSGIFCPSSRKPKFKTRRWFLAQRVRRGRPRKPQRRGREAGEDEPRAPRAPTPARSESRLCPRLPKERSSGSFLFPLLP